MNEPINRPLGVPLPAWMMSKSIYELQAINEEVAATGKTHEEVVASNEWKKRLPPEHNN